MTKTEALQLIQAQNDVIAAARQVIAYTKAEYIKTLSVKVGQRYKNGRGVEFEISYLTVSDNLNLNGGRSRRVLKSGELGAHTTLYSWDLERIEKVCPGKEGDRRGQPLEELC